MRAMRTASISNQFVWRFCSCGGQWPIIWLSSRLASQTETDTSMKEYCCASGGCRGTARRTLGRVKQRRRERYFWSCGIWMSQDWSNWVQLWLIQNCRYMGWRQPRWMNGTKWITLRLIEAMRMAKRNLSAPRREQIWVMSARNYSGCETNDIWRLSWRSGNSTCCEGESRDFWQLIVLMPQDLRWCS